MEDFIILKSGYDIAVTGILSNLEDLDNYYIIKERILRQQRNFYAKKEGYSGTLYKYYDKENQMGYIIFDDIYELKGVCILINKNECSEISEKDLIFVKNTIPCAWKENFNDKEKMVKEYNEMVNKFNLV